MWYIEEWTGASGHKQTRLLSEDEHCTLMCSSRVIFKSDDYNDARKEYDRITSGGLRTARSMARKEIIEKMKMLRDNSIERNRILTDLSVTLKKYEEILK